MCGTSVLTHVRKLSGRVVFWFRVRRPRRVRIDERLHILGGHPKFAADPDRAQRTLMDPGADRRFAHFQKLRDFMSGHEWSTQHGSVLFSPKMRDLALLSAVKRSLIHIKDVQRGSDNMRSIELKSR